MDLRHVNFAENLATEADQAKVLFEDECAVDAHQVGQKMSKPDQSIIEFGQLGVVHSSIVVPRTHGESQGAPEFEHPLHQPYQQRMKPQRRIILRKTHAKTKPLIDHRAAPGFCW